MPPAGGFRRGYFKREAGRPRLLPALLVLAESALYLSTEQPFIRLRAARPRPIDNFWFFPGAGCGRLLRFFPPDELRHSDTKGRSVGGAAHNLHQTRTKQSELSRDQELAVATAVAGAGFTIGRLFATQLLNPPEMLLTLV